MGITSIFLPSNALQGEEIPSFLIWKDLDFTKIEITKPPILKIKDIYNVEEGCYKEEDKKIIVDSVEVDGFLGLLFNSERTSDPIESFIVSYKFINQDKIIKMEKEITLFRPQISIIKQPSTITIKNDSIPEDERIILRNVGDGTCIIMFKTSETSEVQITEPKRMREFIEGYRSVFRNELEDIKEKFPQFNQEIEDIIYLMTTSFDLEDKEQMEEARIRGERIDNSVIWHEEKFFKYVIDAYVISVLKNINIITIAEHFLDYLSSIEKRRVILLNSLDIIPISTSRNKIEYEIHCMDLLGIEFPVIKLSPIEISGTEETEISVFNLFKWS